MTVNDYLNPDSMRNQCSQAVSRMEEDNRALEIAERGIDKFAVDPEIESQSFYALKQQLKSYKTLIEASKIANDTDIRDFQSLSVLVGNEVLDGNRIFFQMENALRMKERYLFHEAVCRGKMIAAEEAFIYVYYSRKAERYARLAENSQRLYEKWQRKTEKYDEINAGTSGLFVDSESIRNLIQKGLLELSNAFKNGTYVINRDSTWKRQLKSECLRLSMCFGDKGGDQNGPYYLWKRGIESDKEYIRKLVQGYKEYEDYSDDEIGKLLMKLEDEGCGYVAFANIIADEYRKKEGEFEEKFGFPLFLQNTNGDTYINYNQLIIDLYCASDNRDKSGRYDSREDFSDTKGAGTSPESRAYRFESYMKDYGVRVEIRDVACDVSNVYEKCKKEMNEGHRMIISTCPVRLKDAKGEPAWMDGAHAMTVTGLTDDGRIEVSSWGEKYYITPEDSDYTSPEKNRAGEAYIKLQSVSFQEE